MNEAQAKDKLIDVMRENETLRLQLNGMTSMKDALIDEAEKLRADLTNAMKCSDILGRDINDFEQVIAELRSELAAIKPDWTTAPKAIYRALDSFGAWHLYQEEPYINNDVEYKGLYFDDAYWNGARANMIPNWCDTLERRPEET